MFGLECRYYHDTHLYYTFFRVKKLLTIFYSKLGAFLEKESGIVQYNTPGDLIWKYSWYV